MGFGFDITICILRQIPINNYDQYHKNTIRKEFYD
jgi:nucleoside-specific outer membrane channel protein Tsx